MIDREEDLAVVVEAALAVVASHLGVVPWVAVPWVVVLVLVDLANNFYLLACHSPFLLGVEPKIDGVEAGRPLEKREEAHVEVWSD